jgi:feruloyl-CoA synthase
MSGNAAAVLTRPAFRKIEWLERDIAVERRDDGVIILKSRIPLKAYEKHIPASLAKWAGETPERTWLAQRTGADRQWRKVSFAEAKRTVDALTQALLNLKLEPSSPVAILSGNSIEHALMTMAAMQARHPAAPVSPAYSLMSQDHAKLRYLFDLIKPDVVMVQDGPTFEKALKALPLDGVTVIHVARPGDGIKSIAFADLAATPVTDAVEQSIAAITPDSPLVLTLSSWRFGCRAPAYPGVLIRSHYRRRARRARAAGGAHPRSAPRRLRV